MDKQIKIFLFWIGDNKKNPQNAKILNKRFPKLNFIIGPTKEEHNYLIQNVEFYRKSFEQKIYAFCSDVWRVYKLSLEKGFYIDASVDFGHKFEQKIIDIYNNFSAAFVKEGFNYLENGYLLSNSHISKEFFKFTFNIYKNRKNVKSPHIYHYGPITLTYSFMRFFNEIVLNNKKIQVEKRDNYKILFLSIHYVKDERYIFNKGLGSWGIRCTINNEVINRKEHWIYGNIKKWDTGHKSLYWDIDKLQLENDYPYIKNIKNAYEYSYNKKMNKYYLSEYKKISRVSFKDKIIWSKLFRFFTGKWLKTK